ncbi:MAG: NFACT RNA binding domain-containing protein [Deferrisomatales bacterium]|nr:NFACT RNA binding domain-containing protein [Deferrisomatales bacterium]
MDSFVLARLAGVLERDWAGAWLQGAWEDREGRLVLKLRQRGRNGLLLLGANGASAGLGLVPRRPPCPQRPTALAAYLRAHGHGTLRAVRVVAGQRVVELELGSPDSACRVVLEALPRAGRIVAVDAAGVVRAAAAGGGWGAAGNTYVRPELPADRPLPDAVGERDLVTWLAAGEPLHRRVLGLGAALGREVAHRAAAGEPWGAWCGVLEECSGPGPLWRVGDQLSAARLTCQPDRGTARTDLLEAAGEHLLADAAGVAHRAQESSAEKAYSRFERRLQRRLANIRADLANLPDPAEARDRADALGAVLWQVEAGQRSVQAPDLRIPGVVHDLPLDPGLSPGRNLNQLYLLARKRERTRQALEARLSASERELAAGPAETQERQAAEGRAESTGPYRRFRSSDGWSLRVGRNGAENERLVRESKPWDLWLHVRDAAGAHVVIRKPGRDSRVPERTLTEAAGLAARFSSRAADGAVEVQVAEIARLRKPKGASPGQVLVAGDRTVRVPPGAGDPVPDG